MGHRDPPDERVLHRRPAHEEAQRQRQGPLPDLLIPVALMHLQREIQVSSLYYLSAQTMGRGVEHMPQYLDIVQIVSYPMVAHDCFKLPLSSHNQPKNYM